MYGARPLSADGECAACSVRRIARGASRFIHIHIESCRSGPTRVRSSYRSRASRVSYDRAEAEEKLDLSDML